MLEPQMKASSRLKILSEHLVPEAQDAGPDSQAEDASHAASNSCRSGFPQAQDMSAFPDATHDLLALSDLLPAKAKAIQEVTRAFMVKEVAPVIAGFWERAEFPHELVPKMAKLGLGGGTLSGHGCPGHSILEAAMGIVEIARVDASMSTFIMVHNFLGMLTIGLLGSERQRAELLPSMARLQRISAWALTEPSNGSDAAGLQSTAEWLVGAGVNGGDVWRLNGQKRWIGNATFADVIIVWARDTRSDSVSAFIVRKGTPGLTTRKIENKTALRCVQNADIFLKNVLVPDSDRLPGVSSFQDTNKVLGISRVMVAWQPVGIATGVYDMCVRYVAERKQFGRPLAAFQLQQERLSRIAGSLHAMWLSAWRVSELLEAGTMSHAQASLVKAHNTLRGREVVALAREILGGNGVVSDFLVAKAHADMEAIYTYEGTYDINSLVVGREITGVAAFKPR
eukprot:jgi/Ulvmu1/6047/UM027_0024.1